MKTILLGGLDSSFREQVCSAFAPHRAEYGLCVLVSIGELRQQLATSQGDLIVLDLDAQGEASLEWLAVLAEFRASTPVLAIGQEASPDVQGYDQKFPDRYFPLVKYLQKPVTAEAILEAAEAELRLATWGVIQGLSLPSLLQMLSMERKTCTIRVTCGRRHGFLYLRDGQIINARYRRQEALESAYLLLETQFPIVEIDSQLHDPTQHIRMRLEEILMGAARFQDDITRETKGGTGVVGDGQLDEIPASEVGKWEHSSQPIPQSISAKPRRGLGWLLGLAGAMALAGAWWAFLPRSVDVDIQSSPNGAAVRLDGTLRGATPLKLTLPRPPHGTLALELPGREPQQHTLKSGDRVLFFSLNALPAPGPVSGPTADPVPVATGVLPEERHRKVPKVKPKSVPNSQEKSRKDIFDQLRNTESR